MNLFQQSTTVSYVVLLLVLFLFTGQAQQNDNANKKGKSINEIDFQPLLNFETNASNFIKHTNDPSSRGGQPMGPKNMKINRGNYQPFDDSFHFSFSAFNVSFAFEMKLMQELLEENTKINVYNGATLIESIPSRLVSYQSVLPQNNGWATVTLNEDGTMYGVINTGSEIYQIDPVNKYRNKLNTRTFNRLTAAAADNGMIIFKHSTLQLPYASCGSTVADNSTISTSHLNSRKLLAINSWVGNCFTNDDQLHYLSIGVAATFSYVDQFPDYSTAAAVLSAEFANVNAIYKAQMNVYVSIHEFVLVSTSATVDPLGSNLYNWNSCTDIVSMLVKFQNWRHLYHPQKYALWHLVTDCFQSGTVGLAYVGSVGWGTAVSSDFGGVLWQVITHEIGHNLNANHSSTGIMTTTLPATPIDGVHQFESTGTSKNRMCTHIQSTLSNKDQLPYTWNKVCGLGITDGTAFKSASTMCSSTSVSAGYCSNGQCVQSTCAVQYGLTFCGINSCKQKCQTGTNAATCADSDINVPDYVGCGSEAQPAAGVCISGQCINTSWRTSNLSPCCGNTQTRMVQCYSTNDNVIRADHFCTGPKPPTSVSCSYWPTTTRYGSAPDTEYVGCYRSNGISTLDNFQLINNIQSLCPAPNPSLPWAPQMTFSSIKECLGLIGGTFAITTVSSDPAAANYQVARLTPNAAINSNRTFDRHCSFPLPANSLTTAGCSSSNPRTIIQGDGGSAAPWNGGSAGVRSDCTLQGSYSPAFSTASYDYTKNSYPDNSIHCKGKLQLSNIDQSTWAVYSFKPPASLLMTPPSYRGCYYTEGQLPLAGGIITEYAGQAFEQYANTCSYVMSGSCFDSDVLSCRTHPVLKPEWDAQYGASRTWIGISKHMEENFHRHSFYQMLNPAFQSSWQLVPDSYCEGTKPPHFVSNSCPTGVRYGKAKGCVIIKGDVVSAFQQLQKCAGVSQTGSYWAVYGQ